jgi:uncharacterized protein YbjT (DUF2867 family)
MYAVAGATGKTGGAVAEALLAAGRQVRVITRDSAHAEGWRSRGAEVAESDLRDVSALTDALRGARGAYLLVPTDPSVADIAADQASIVEGICGAIRAAGTPRVVFLSAIGAELPTGTGPISGLHRAEQALIRIPGTVSFFLRSVYFIDNVAGSLGMLEQNIVPTFLPEKLEVPMVATADVGAAAARLLTGEEAGGAPLYAVGPRDYSYGDVAQVLSHLLDRQITCQRVPFDAMVATLTSLGISTSVAESYREMHEALANGQLTIPPEAARLTGSTDLDTVLTQLLATTARQP